MRTSYNMQYFKQLHGCNNFQIEMLNHALEPKTLQRAKFESGPAIKV